MFNYVCLGTSDLEAAIRLYDAMLSPLGLERCVTEATPDWQGWAGWGVYEQSGGSEHALWVCKPFNGEPASSGNGTMVALVAHSWEAVRAFYDQAMLHGGKCEGVPGLRRHYHSDFYAAYIRDLDGNKVAAICRGFTAQL
ncbi:VOC family protein [Pseudomonas yamanorum]|nr:VOC family protein [Pseudomonas yamanorum]